MKRLWQMNFRKVVAVLCVVMFAQSALIFSAQAPLPVQVAPPQSPQPVDSGQPPVVLLAPNQLDDLVAPIALYPDPLISQVLVASTYPLEVVEASQWLLRNPNLNGTALTQAVERQDWDPSVQALTPFPDVLKYLTEDIAW